MRCVCAASVLSEHEDRRACRGGCWLHSQIAGSVVSVATRRWTPDPYRGLECSRPRHLSRLTPIPHLAPSRHRHKHLHRCGDESAPRLGEQECIEIGTRLIPIPSRMESDIYVTAVSSSRQRWLRRIHTVQSHKALTEMPSRLIERSVEMKARIAAVVAATVLSAIVTVPQYLRKPSHF